MIDGEFILKFKNSTLHIIFNHLESIVLKFYYELLIHPNNEILKPYSNSNFIA